MEMNYTASLFPPFISPSSPAASSATTMAEYDYLHQHQALTGLDHLDDDDDHRKEVSFGTAAAGNKREGDEEVEKKLEMVGKKNSNKKTKKPKYAFQTRSQVDILDDGYRWRKYGQKAVKNNKFPRSYYRCTYQGCNVKKQVQRLTKDEGVVVTTYEGMHSHPIEKSMDNFEHILNQMHIYASV